MMNEQIREIRRLLRATMNGPVSHSMRQQGLNYRVNFGVDQPRLLEIAATLPHDTDLAIALWKEDTRELRLLAPMLMPHESMDQELALLWVEQIVHAEEAQVLVLHLLRHLPIASALAFRLVASERDMERLVAWLLLGRLFMEGNAPSQRDADELLDHLVTELGDEKADPEVRRTALNTLYKYMELGASEEARGERILQGMGL
ncbi:MAG: DNA alkylation repair protein [Bacteroidales bacterium]|nr:DNA alkylation repair protein [Bacteroidales bacterium]